MGCCQSRPNVHNSVVSVNLQTKATNENRSSCISTKKDKKAPEEIQDIKNMEIQQTNKVEPAKLSHPENKEKNSLSDQHKSSQQPQKLDDIPGKLVKEIFTPEAPEISKVVKEETKPIEAKIDKSPKQK